MSTLLDKAARLLKERPLDKALVFVSHEGEHSITYADFFAQAARYARALEAVGIKPGDLAVLVLPHSEALLYGFWGAILLGAVPSIFPFLSDKLDPERYFSSVRQLIEHEGVKAVITDQELEPRLRQTLDGLNVALLTVDAIEAAAADERRPGELETLDTLAEFYLFLGRNPAKPEDTAFLQHSSGSTGLQKGVMLSHGSVINQIESYSEAIGLSKNDVIVSWLPLYHDMGLIAGFVTPIMQGVKLVLMSPFQWVRDPKILLHAIHRYRGTLCWLPNFAYNFLATRIRDKDIDGVSLSSMRAFINCSEPVYAESHRVFAERFQAYGLGSGSLATCYAMAENTFAVTQSAVGTPVTRDRVDRRRLMEKRRALPVSPDAQIDTPVTEMVSCGQPIPGCQVQIVDEKRQPLPERHVGEVALRSDSMLTGYYRRPDATNDALAEGWYFTGDFGYLADGELYITGRKKDLIIVGGKNVYPQDIENLLNDIEGVHPGRTVAFGVFNDSLGTEDIAVVAEVEDGLDDEARGAISRAIRAKVAQNTDVMARYVHLVDAKWLVKTSSGKVARAANREKFIAEVIQENK